MNRDEKKITSIYQLFNYFCYLFQNLSFKTYHSLPFNRALLTGLLFAINLKILSNSANK